jgi:hypothetical protein
MTRYLLFLYLIILYYIEIETTEYPPGEILRPFLTSFSSDSQYLAKKDIQPS